MLRAFFIVLACAYTATAADPAKDAYGDPLPEGAIARIGTERLGNLDPFYGMQLTPDCKHLVAMYRKENTLFDVTTGLAGAKLRVPSGGRNQSMHLLSTNGKVAATVGYDGVEVWEFETGANIHSIKRRIGVSAADGGAALSADGRFLAIGGEFNEKEKEKPVTAVVWDLNAKKEIASVKVIQNSQCTVAISSDGMTLLTRGRHRNDAKEKPLEPADDPNRMIEIWDLGSGKIKATLSNVNTEYAAISPNGKTVATSSGRGDLTLSDANTGKILHELAGRSGMGGGLHFSPDGKIIAAVFRATLSIQLWNVESGETIGFAECPITGNYLSLRALRFAGNERIVAAATLHSRTFTWEIPSGKLLSPPGGLHYSILSLSFANEDKEILASEGGASITRWSRNGKKLEPLRLRMPGQSEYYLRTAHATFTHDGKLAYQADEGGLGIYDLPAGVQRALVSSPNKVFNEYILSGDGKRGGAIVPPRYQKPEPYHFYLTDLEKGRRSDGFAFPNGQPTAMALAHDGSKLFFFRTVRPEKGEADTSFCAIDTATGKILAEEKIKSGYNSYPKIIPTFDGKFLLVITPAGNMAVYETTSLKFLREFKTKTKSPATAPRFSPDGSLLAIAGESNYDGEPSTIEIYNWASGELVNSFTGHSRSICSLAFSKDGKTLASGSFDTTILLWDLTKMAKD